ncbi:lipopolysaccharide assembly LapA domain-containing protein [Sporolactobacillus sp. THM19-2]|uniref:LapA family protein n=1 Tax=Sporolactobacillus sp. THM19-2 TaxID=2511171 RepID=UPI00101FC226|nr:LapA family protein [Sporolactobacillus sp. THM19-2]RYL94711.1 LapA family protein [Sporolactobacillus sp. THM19-2]
MKKQWNILLILIFTLIVVLFSIDNVDSVTFSYLFGKADIPLILVIIGSVLIGVLLIGLSTYIKIYKQRRRIVQLERQIQRLASLHPEDAEKLAIKVSGGEEEEEGKRVSRKHLLSRK